MTDVVVEHVAKSFENGRIHALDDVSFRVEPAELVALTGPSGCGKSTLLNLIGALDRPDSGRIAVGGKELNGVGDASEYRATTAVTADARRIPSFASFRASVPLLGT